MEIARPTLAIFHTITCIIVRNDDSITNQVSSTLTRMAKHVNYMWVINSAPKARYVTTWLNPCMLQGLSLLVTYSDFN